MIDQRECFNQVTNQDTIVCIPTLNEADTITELLGLLWNYRPDFSALVIDDNSADGTAETVEGLRDNRVSVLRRVGKLGFASAYIDGFNWALERGYSWIVQMDADLSHHPRHLDSFVQAREYRDFVIGSRYVEGGAIPNWSRLRRTLSLSANRYARVMLSRELCDYTGGYNMWNRRVLESLDLRKISSRGYSFLIELKYAALCAGFSGIEIPITFEERREGQSKMSSSIIAEAVYRVPKMRMEY